MTSTPRDARVEEAKDEVGTKGLTAEFEVDVPAPELLRILWDVNNFGRLFPDVREAHVVGGADDDIEVAYRVDAVIKQVAYTLRRSFDRERGMISWREVSGDLRRVRGAWHVTPAASGRALVKYSAFVDVGRFVPTAMVRDLAMRKVDEMVTRLRRVAGELHAEASRSTSSPAANGLVP